MEDVAAKEAFAGAASTTTFYPADLVSYQQSVHGLVDPSIRTCSPADEFLMLRADGTEVTKKAGDTDVALLDRSNLHAGQIVVSASDVDGGNIGVVTGVTTLVDLAHLGSSGVEVFKGVSPSGLRRVRPLSLGDYVVSGSWLGRVVEVTLDVDITFDDGTVCRVTDVGSKGSPTADERFIYRPQGNVGFYPGMRLVNTGTSDFFRGSHWLKGHGRWVKGHRKLAGEVGTVARVEMAGVLVCWIASAHYGTDQQLVHEFAPPAYQDPANLTFFCSDSSCSWSVADRCFLLRSSIADSASSEQAESSSLNDLAAPITKKEHEERSTNRKQPREPTSLEHRQRAQQRHSEPLSTMIVSNTHTTIDVVWQDGTRQHGVPSTSINPFTIMNDDEVFPGQYVVDATTDDIAGDDVVGVAKGSTRRVGVVKGVNSKDHTVNVSWFKASSLPDEANRWETECAETVSAYDLDTDPDNYVFYGDVVVRLQPNVSGSKPLVQQPHADCIKQRASVDLSWVGRVVDLHDGHAQVKWGDGSTSKVLPHEIIVANKEHYTELEAEMGDWVEEDWVEDDSVEEDSEEEDHDDALQEFHAASTDNDPTYPRNVEGGRVEDNQGSINELDGSLTTRTGRLAGFIQSMTRAVVQVLVRGKWYLVNWSSSSALDLPKTMQHAEVTVHKGSQHDPSIVGTETRSDASVDDNDLTHGVVKAREAVRGDEDPSKFPHFDVVQSPQDHHYIDSDQGSSGGRTWVKAVQKEWKILETSLPDTIYVRAFEDRMDLLRVAMVGASGTPYQDGLFFFDLHLPPSYPTVPPEVYHHSFGLRLNPNLDESGTVCLSLLDTFGGEDTKLWTPGTSSLLQVVVSIQALVLNDQPFYNEDGYEDLVDKPEGHRNALPYNENAFLLTLRTMLHLLRRPPQGFEGLVRDHFHRRGKHVLRTCEAYLRGCVPDDEGNMKLPCSSGLRITLANLVPRLVAAFTGIEAVGCDHGPLTCY